MKKTSIIAVTLTTVAALTTTSVLARDGGGRDKQGRQGQMLKKADANKDGKLSVDEVVAQASARFDKSDADGDGVISLQEMTDSIQRQRDERRAKRMLERMDFNGDGKVTKDEIENRAKKRFAMMDRNDDGFVEKTELRKGRKGMGRSGKGQRRYKKRGAGQGEQSDNL